MQPLIDEGTASPRPAKIKVVIGTAVVCTLLAGVAGIIVWHQQKTSSNRTTSELCEFKYEGICFWSEIGRTKHLTFDQADEVCKRNNSTSANVYSETHYVSIVKHVQDKLGDLQYADVAIGVRLDPTTQVVPTTNGRGGYVYWYRGLPGYPKEILSWTRVYIFVVKNADPHRLGMLNHYPKTKLHGALCEVVK